MEVIILTKEIYNKILNFHKFFLYMKVHEFLSQFPVICDLKDTIKENLI